MRSKLLGVALIIHGLAHATAGMWAAGESRPMVVTALWLVATTGFLLAGGAMLGLINAGRVRGVTALAATSSLILLVVFRHEWFLPGMIIDVLLLALVAGTETPVSDAKPIRMRPLSILFVVFVSYTALLIGMREWTFTWGSTPRERWMSLMGDEKVADPHYRIDHAITINAPAESVWPWIAQIGQDRAGFYSYDWLERAIGADVRNVSRIVPEWQQRQVGDLVRGAQENYLGGIAGDSVGWRVTHIEPGKGMVLDGWGAFVVHPVDSRTSRLHIRSRGDAEPSLRSLLLAPVSMLTLEPAHFIMERRMLKTIKDLAENQTGSGNTQGGTP